MVLERKATIYKESRFSEYLLEYDREDF